MRKHLCVAVVVLFVATAGCLGGNAGPSNGNATDEGDLDGNESITGGEIANNSLTAIEDVGGYSFVLNQTVESRPLENGTNISLADFRVNLHRGLIDLRDRELRMDMRSSTEETQEPRVGDMYIVEGVQYMGVRTPNGTQWSTSNNTNGIERTLSVNDRVGILDERLRNATAEYIRTEEVNGTDAYLLEVDPSNPDAYINDIVEPTEDGPRVIKVEATNVSLRLWVNTRTGLPARMYETIEARTMDRREKIDRPEVNFRFETRYDAYNYTEDDISIEVPEEAREAT